MDRPGVLSMIDSEGRGTQAAALTRGRRRDVRRHTVGRPRLSTVTALNRHGVTVSDRHGDRD
jgi:hypothetical protein